MPSGALTYGGYDHDTGEADVKISIEIIRNDALEALMERHRWTIDGRIVSASPQGAADALIAAYSRDGRSASWFNHSLPNGSAIGGVRVVSTSFPRGDQAELVTMRTWQAVLEADYPVSGAYRRLVNFEERIEKRGGGPRFDFLELAYGFPEEQTLREHTVFHYVQEGSAVGFGGYPDPARIAPPIWRSRLMEAPDIREGNPRAVGSGGGREYIEFPISWRYVFRSARALTGRPHAWPK